ncbi:glucuronate isomerase [Pelagicoccus sp. SDUM812005]|uniref:glucuronate isomerase n=1 Tax=Pelagicoccus sp. SDUM812005 TaxID=3041257 RepID=UPI00280CAF9E|nr:glucuronate isomerase [Pelagicoccus sp. SDUM812005]MDQ8181599.1 glucuronate isomerase [Pelagicoccus sp. SDUM812005]
MKVRNEFLDDRFLLPTDFAVELYEGHAKELPIVDFHCHLDPVEVADNAVAEDIVELWIEKDPYKWRAMRMNGVPEALVTGTGQRAEKMAAWAEVLPRLLGSPLYQWSMLELKRCYGIEEALRPENAAAIRETCNERLRAGGLGTGDILRRFKVETLCTSDAWLDDLAPHKRSRDLRLRPSLRGDAALDLESSSYGDWASRVCSLAGGESPSLDGLKAGLAVLMDRFIEAGCCLADHGLSDFRIQLQDAANLEESFAKLLAGEALEEVDREALHGHLLLYLFEEYSKRGWTLQLHVGACRYTSSRLRELAGPAGGYACIGDSVSVADLCRLFDCLEKRGGLPRVILFPMNPSDYEKFATVSGSFVEGGVAAKVQLGPAWWYNDHLEGIRRQLKATAHHGLLGRFVGMTTDSRSALSMTRHEYFRRTFCGLLGEWADLGLVPRDAASLGSVIEDVCYGNAAQLMAGNPVRG